MQPKKTSSSSSSSSSSRHLRDSLTILADNIPSNKRPRLLEQQQQEKEEEQQPQQQQQQILHNLQTTYLREFIPVLISGPLVAKPSSTSNNHHDHTTAYIRTTLKKTGGDKKEEQNNQEDKSDKKEDDHPPNTASPVPAGTMEEPSTQQQCYKNKLKELKRDKERILEKRKEIFQGYARLISSYEYGLKYISNLKDLTQSPDNFMQGNFIDSTLKKCNEIN